MTYKEWDEAFTVKRNKVLASLQDKTVEEVTEYFEYSNMALNEPNFCELYKTNTRCHNIEYLNCYNCGCPFFKYDDDARKQPPDYLLPTFSICTINAKNSNKFESPAGTHLDCSDCTIPHTKKFTLSQITKDLNDA